MTTVWKEVLSGFSWQFLLIFRKFLDQVSARALTVMFLWFSSVQQFKCQDGTSITPCLNHSKTLSSSSILLHCIVWGTDSVIKWSKNGEGQWLQLWSFHHLIVVTRTDAFDCHWHFKYWMNDEDKVWMCSRPDTIEWQKPFTFKYTTSYLSAASPIYRKEGIFFKTKWRMLTVCKDIGKLTKLNPIKSDWVRLTERLPRQSRTLTRFSGSVKQFCAKRMHSPLQYLS